MENARSFFGKHLLEKRFSKLYKKVLKNLIIFSFSCIMGLSINGDIFYIIGCWLGS